MPKHLIVVESPAKAEPVSKYLGKDFTCLASYGHVRDLLPKQGAVDTENGFGMKYVLLEKNKKHVDAIVKAMKKAGALYLATDPDREGDAISWHLHEILKAEDVLDDKPVHRVEFHEITKTAIKHAIEQPRALSENLINAQQARRALDYLVGFNLSPLLWKKVRRGLSAGRVQSPALRLIVARAEEIEAILQSRAQGRLLVTAVEKKQRRRNPSPPFTTSTLQQEAARKLGFSAQRTMRTAQQLYE